MLPPTDRFLRSLQAAGVRRVPRGRPGAADPVAVTAERGSTGATLAPDEVARQLESIAAEVTACRACALCQGRQHAVPGEGSPRADVVFIGEGPGADEDRTGRPFVGRAGQLLDAIITKGMRRRREDVYIVNIVKCRPPANRVPLPDEVAACTPYLERQIDVLRPKVICALGTTAARWLLGTSDSMARLRGKVHRYRTIPVIPTYHPAYLLRNPAGKPETWKDIQKVMELADIG